MSEEAPRQKRKYTKRAKMLLRSNNDYIDHTYWPKVYKAAKEREHIMLEKYGVVLPQKEVTVNGEIRVRKISEVEEIPAIEKDEPLFHIPIIED